jgi:uncharacterized protein YbgA (DUF1722 family)
MPRKKFKDFTVTHFIIHCSAEEFDNFLMHLLIYFHCFIDKLEREEKIRNVAEYM